MRRGGGGIGEVLDLEAESDRRVAAEHADLAEIDAVGEADHAALRRMVEEEQREADARKDHEQRGREEEDRDGEQARGREEAATDDAAAPEDARDVDGEARAIARALAVVALDLATEVAEHERARRDDEEADEAEAVREAAAEDRAGDEVQQREDDDLLVVRGAAPRGEADDLEDGGELDGDVERRPTGEEANALDREERERPDGREVTERGSVLPGLRHREGEGEADEHERGRPRRHRARVDDGEHAERRERVGHDAVDEAEPHVGRAPSRCRLACLASSAAFSVGGFGGDGGAGAGAGSDGAGRSDGQFLRRRVGRARGRRPRRARGSGGAGRRPSSGRRERLRRRSS